MGKLLLLLCVIGLVLLSVGTSMMPENPAFWLASGLPKYQLARLSLTIIIVLQLGASPLRHRWFRLFSASTSLMVGTLAVVLTATGIMMFLDTLTFLASTVAISVSTLEAKAAAVSKVKLPGKPKDKLAFGNIFHRYRRQLGV